MAQKIRGITIELGADFTQVTDAFNKVTKELGGVDKSLKDVNKLLKLDPSNVELLAQKQGYLEEAISLTAQKLLEEQKMLESMPTDANGELTEQQKALAREIEATKLQLSGYENELEKTKGAQDQAKTSADKLGDQVEEAAGQAEKGSSKWKMLGEAFTGINQGLELFQKGLSLVSNVYDKLIGDTVKLADDLMTQSSVTGLSTDELQEYAYMAELVDTDVSTITGSLTKLTRNMDSAKSGTGSAADAFKTLGIDIYNADGTMRDANDVFGEAIDKLGTMENQTERDALAMDLFGKSGQELNPIIDAGSEAIDNFRKEAHDMGYVLDEETLDSLGGIDDSMQKLDNAFQTAKNTIAVALAPVVADLTEKFVEWVQSVDWDEVRTNVQNTMQGISNAIKKVWPIIETLITWIGKAIDIANDLFSGNWELPHIKLPHPYISPRGWSLSDLLKGTIPRIGIEWYSKGYEGLVLDGATIFGMNKNGQLMAGGERGREIIIGEDKLRSMMGGTTINVVVNEATNAEATAEAVMQRMQLALATNERTWK